MDVAVLRVRFEDVIRIADQRLSDIAGHPDEDIYRLIRENFQTYVSQLPDGPIMNEAGNGYGLGAGRALSDWGLEDDEMRSAVGRAEAYFRKGI